MPSRVRSHPYLTLLAVLSALLVLVGRINRTASWGDWVFFAGIGVLVVAGLLYVVLSRR